MGGALSRYLNAWPAAVLPTDDIGTIVDTLIRSLPAQFLRYKAAAIQVVVYTPDMKKYLLSFVKVAQQEFRSSNFFYKLPLHDRANFLKRFNALACSASDNQAHMNSAKAPSLMRDRAEMARATAPGMSAIREKFVPVAPPIHTPRMNPGNEDRKSTRQILQDLFGPYANTPHFQRILGQVDAMSERQPHPHQIDRTAFGMDMPSNIALPTDMRLDPFAQVVPENPINLPGLGDTASFAPGLRVPMSPAGTIASRPSPRYHPYDRTNVSTARATLMDLPGLELNPFAQGLRMPMSPAGTIASSPSPRYHPYDRANVSTARAIPMDMPSLEDTDPFVLGMRVPMSPAGTIASSPSPGHLPYDRTNVSTARATSYMNPPTNNFFATGLDPFAQMLSETPIDLPNLEDTDPLTSAAPEIIGGATNYFDAIFKPSPMNDPSANLVDDLPDLEPQILRDLGGEMDQTEAIVPGTTSLLDSGLAYMDQYLHDSAVPDFLSSATF